MNSFIVSQVKNKIYCDVCNKFYIDSNYKRHLKSQENINNFIKKRKVISVIFKISILLIYFYFQF